MTRLLIATRNSNKLREISDKLQFTDSCELLDLNAAGVSASPDEDSIEAFGSFEENALAKARYFAGLSGLITLADDSGICVDALQGAPGVRSKRLSGRSDLSSSALDHANNERLLQLLKNVPDDLRTAHYTCALAMVSPDGPEATVIGHCHGLLGSEPHGTGGFGYDPLFYLPQFGATFAELPAEVKAQISHRARAIEQLRLLLPLRVDDFGVLL